ncbi:hypothetical protein HDE_03161 [Halotydeus destructor]|nr:hypothetical protein HDE_03161 [Halotydeus destructor]
MCVPIFPNKGSFLLIQVVLGIASAGLNNAPNALLAEIWEDKCNPYIQTLHFCYAIGMVMGPLISGPFMDPRADQSPVMTPNSTDIYLTTTTPAFKSMVHVSYVITSAINILAALSVVILFIASPYKNAGRKTEAKIVPNNTKKPLIQKKKSKYYVTYIVLLCGLLVSCDYGLEENFFAYMQVYSVLGPIKLDAATGAYLSSASSVAFAVGRLVSIPTAAKISARAMLYLDGVSMITGSFIILLWNTEFGLWVGYIVLGFGFSSVFPTIVAYAEQRINVTTYVAGTFMVFASAAGLIVPYFEGKVY